MSHPSEDKTSAGSPAETKVISPRFVYAAISAALLLPVIVWPLSLWGEASLNPSVDIQRIWLAAGIALLLCAVSADSVLGYRQSSLSPMFAALWVLFASLGVSISLRLEQGALILASCFALHALRSGRRLWQGRDDWWLWPAWARDSLAAIAFFVWNHLILHG